MLYCVLVSICVSISDLSRHFACQEPHIVKLKELACVYQVQTLRSSIYRSKACYLPTLFQPSK